MKKTCLFWKFKLYYFLGSNRDRSKLSLSINFPGRKRKRSLDLFQPSMRSKRPNLLLLSSPNQNFKSSLIENLSKSESPSSESRKLFSNLRKIHSDTDINKKPPKQVKVQSRIRHSSAGEFNNDSD